MNGESDSHWLDVGSWTGWSAESTASPPDQEAAPSPLLERFWAQPPEGDVLLYLLEEAGHSELWEGEDVRRVVELLERRTPGPLALETFPGNYPYVEFVLGDMEPEAMVCEDLRSREDWEALRRVIERDQPGSFLGEVFCRSMTEDAGVVARTSGAAS